MRGRDCLYCWSEAAALELSNGSNGWFRFILDSKLATMYSSGSPEGGSDSSENRGEFLEKLQRAQSQIKVGTVSQPVLSQATSTRLIIGNWALTCKKEGEVQIHNSDGQQVSICTMTRILGCYNPDLDKPNSLKLSTLWLAIRLLLMRLA